MSLRKVISSGQAGVERAALDSAIRMPIYSWGGWVPKGRLAEDGEMPSSYFDVERIGCGLEECPRGRPSMARLRNIRDSDATLILRPARIGGTLPESIKLVIRSCRNLGRPYRILDPYKTARIPSAVRWICETNAKEGDDEEHQEIRVLNVVGLKESKHPGIYDRSLTFINDILSYTSVYKSWGIKIWAPSKRKEPHK